MYNLEVSVSVLITRKGEIDRSDYPQMRETDKNIHEGTYISCIRIYKKDKRAKIL